jgi:uncharacterized DUF497 family protein
MVDFDPAKEAINLAKHGVSLARWVDLDMKKTLVDDRRDYGEIRYRAYGFIDGIPYCLTFTNRNERVRPISLRRMHAKELRRYVPQIERTGVRRRQP